MTSKLIFLCFFLVAMSCVFAQKRIVITGSVLDSQSNPIQNATVGVLGQAKVTKTNAKGMFSLSPRFLDTIFLNIRRLGFEPYSKLLNIKQDTLILSITLKELKLVGNTVTVKDNSLKKAFITEINPKKIQGFVSPSGNDVEAVIKTLPGVSSNNELSSQYNVRGGNFDENLIYVNGIEIYRPFLVKSGSQEGLSFINSDMVEKIKFSAGGFEAMYSDKMSSVLDITYKKPKQREGSISLDLQGANIYYGDRLANNKLSMMHSVRFKSNAYVLSSLNTDGNYKPFFFDAQSLVNYTFSDKWSVEFFGNISQNDYQFIPESRKTSFGSINEALQLSVFFNGQEKNTFSTMFGSLGFNYTPSNDISLRFISSSFSSVEKQHTDIEGFYRIDELERDLGSGNLGEIISNRGVGSYLDHARNELFASISNLEHQGKWIRKKGVISWGGKIQYESITDELSEWSYRDSAGYSKPISHGTSRGQPFNPNDFLLNINEVLKSKNNLINFKTEAYIQKTWNWKSKHLHEQFLNIGVRGNYRSYYKEFLPSLRFAYNLAPNWDNPYFFKLSGGVYYQPPFYREVRDFDGKINDKVRSQKSYQVVLGMNKSFSLWNRSFKFVSEIYYKHMLDLIPYQVDNVRIRYHATNNSNGYATGIDLRLNGELVKNTESWVSLSIMNSKENITDDFYYDYFNSEGEKIIPGFTANSIATDSVIVYPQYLPRPTDQLVNFSLFFQDYINTIPRLKVGLVLHYASGLPYGPPLQHERYKYTARYPDYLRGDITFSYHIKKPSDINASGPLKLFKDVNISLQVFNLLQVNNVISYLWIQDVSGRQYAVPNFLTSRQVNLRLGIAF